MEGIVLASEVLFKILQTSLGPKGLDKLLINTTAASKSVDNVHSMLTGNNVVVTNDGATILSHLQSSSPVISLFTQLANAQDSAVGDGTTSSVLLAIRLIIEASKLTNQSKGVPGRVSASHHPLTILDAYLWCVDRCIEHIDTRCCININEMSPEQKHTLLHMVAVTSLNSKSLNCSYDIFANLAVKSVKYNYQRSSPSQPIHKLRILGGSLDHSDLLGGYAFTGKRTSQYMPQIVSQEDNTISVCLLDCMIDQTLSLDTRIEIIDNDLGESSNVLANTKSIIESGATVVFCTSKIPSMSIQIFVEHNMFVVEQVQEDVLNNLSFITGGKIMQLVDFSDSTVLGCAIRVEERTVSGVKLILVEGKTPACTVLLRGPSRLGLEEAERALHDAQCCVSRVLLHSLVVPGGGAIEAELATMLESKMSSAPSHYQLSIQAFSSSLMVLPGLLAQNAGYDPIDVTAKLRSMHAQELADNSKSFMGINLSTGTIANMKEAGILEPVHIKKTILQLASETVAAIIRIDNILIAH